MNDDGGRAQRHRVEELQGRAKQARLELDEAETPGFTDQLEQLAVDAAAAEKDVALLERDARTTAGRLAVVTHEVEEAERQLLVPRTVSSVSPVVALMTVLLGVGALMAVITLCLAPGPHPLWTQALVVGFGLVPPPILAWLWRRRLSGGGTFRSPS